MKLYSVLNVRYWFIVGIVEGWVEAENVDAGHAGGLQYHWFTLHYFAPLPRAECSTWIWGEGGTMVPSFLVLPGGSWDSYYFIRLFLHLLSRTPHLALPLGPSHGPSHHRLAHGAQGGALGNICIWIHTVV